jgi:Tfp pilus assembly protein PilF
MSLLLDALKKAAEQKEEKSEATITQTVSYYDKTSVMEDTHTEIDNTFTLDENRFESETKEAVVEDPTLTQFEQDATEVLVDDEGQYEDVTQIIELQDSDDQEIVDPDKTVLNYDEDATKILPRHDIDTDITVESTELVDSQSDNQSDNDAVESEELSLALIENDDSTSTQTRSSDEASLLATDTLVPDTVLLKSLITEVQINGSTVELELDEVQEHSATKNDTVSNQLVDLDETVKKGSESPLESAENHNYAQDNYDRTLIKIDHDDASQLFSGMKSDSDALMTPEYARKVFIRNSSIQRFNRYKIYSGVSASIILFIFILGLFEYEEKALIIDNSLKSLKQDPMANLSQLSGEGLREPIKPLMPSENLSIDPKIIVLVENAESSSSVTVQQTKVTAEGVEDREEIKASSTAIGSNEGKPIAKVTMSNPTTTNVTPNRKILIKVAKQAIAEKPNRLQLSSKMAFTGKDQLLKDAYAMYQRGENTVALEKYNRVLVADPKNRNALLARASIQVKNNDRNSAIEDYQTLLIENPKDSLAMSSLISVASISPSKSESQLKEMIKNEPLSPHLNFALGNVYGAQNRWHEAQSLYFKALKNKSSNPNYAYNLAVSLEHISKPKVAIIYYQRALININNGLATFKKSVVEKRLEILKQL